MKDSLDQFAEEKLAALDQKALRRTLVATERGADGDVLRGAGASCRSRATTISAWLSIRA
jgi:hypothetical protein